MFVSRGQCLAVLSFPSSLNGARVGLHLLGSGHCRRGLSSGRSVDCVPLWRPVVAGMLACAGPSRPHTRSLGVPGHGGWGGQRSPVRATATGPGIFRSLGLKNPSGYWLLRRSTYSHTGEGCGQRLGACVCSLCVCWCKRQAWPGGKMASPTMNGLPPPSPPRWASNLRPRDETPVHVRYAMLTMWWVTPPIPPDVCNWLSLGGDSVLPPPPRRPATPTSTR